MARTAHVLRLLERQDQLEMLAHAGERAIEGEGSLVLVGGEAGIGKTALVRAACSQLEADVPFVVGACEPLSVPVPLAALRQLLDAAGGGDLLGSGGGDRLTLARSALGVLRDRAPLLAVVEDAHWADPLTLDLLRILARRVEEAGVVMVVTYRDDEVAANPPLGLLLGDLMTSPSVQRILLGPLSPDGVAQLAAGTGLDEERLSALTGGNPFLLVEAIAAGGRLPASVRDAALSRAGRLSRPAREVADVAAIVGQRFDLELLHALLGECSQAVEEALGMGVLVEDEETLGFRHELIREALEQSISLPRRRGLHARVFGVLAKRLGSDHARLAHHAELGGLTDDAARHAMLAAAEAERLGAVHQTYRQAERALRLRGEQGGAEQVDLLVRYARASNFANPNLEEGIEAAERGVALAEQLGDDARRGQALMALAYALWSLERVVEARSAAQRAVAAFEPTDDTASLAWAYATLIRIEATSFDPAVAVAQAPRAVRLAETARLDEVRVDVSISVGLARGHSGERNALQALTGALDAAKSAGFTIRMVRAYVNLMTVAMTLRAHECVDTVAAEALPFLAELHVSRLPRTAIRLYRARSQLDRGRWEQALAVFSERERWWEGEYAMAAAMEGLIAARRGVAGVEALLEQAWREIVERVDAEGSRHGMVRLALVEAAWLEGDRARAIAELSAARRSTAAARFGRSGGELALWGRRCGVQLEVPHGAPPPVLLELEGDWRRAVDAWRELEAPYEAALACLPGDDRAARWAVAILRKLGADATARAFSRERAAGGARAARGPRRSTLANPAGLTRREQEVLETLATGASNAAIAAELHVSERTVAHHVSAVLGKLGVPNRHLAVEQARRQGLVGEPARR
ncbi:MAG: ATP-binding protein [Solirubrobacteraceae bacterium]